VRGLSVPVIIAVVILGLLAAVVVVGARQVAAQVERARAPEQPIRFDHVIHVRLAQLDCLFCHRNADKGDAATVPSVQQCMFCHVVVGRGNPEVEKVRAKWDAQEPIDWIRVHRMPDHVHFAHAPHIRAGFDCATCHGDVASMPRVQQVRALNMGDCVNCHRENNAPTDCATCHY